MVPSPSSVSLRSSAAEMASKRRNRKRRPARGPAAKSPKRRLLLVCEGEVTEPSYFRGFERWARNNTVEIVVSNTHGVPLTLVQYAAEKKQQAEEQARRKEDSFLAYDEVWCVFDVDEHPRLSDARELARSKQVELAISNPCFELWLLLHWRESPGQRHRHDLQRMLKDYVDPYDKQVDFALFSFGIPDAIRRARRLDEEAEEEGEAGRNPTTGVYLLTDSIAGHVGVPSSPPTYGPFL